MGFAAVALTFQIVFVLIATDPARFRPMMIPSVIEKFSYAAVMLAMYLQQRVRASDLLFVGTDLFLGVLFLAAFFKTRPPAAKA